MFFTILDKNFKLSWLYINILSAKKILQLEISISKSSTSSHPELILSTSYIYQSMVNNHDFFFDLVFTALSRIFHLYRADR